MKKKKKEKKEIREIVEIKKDGKKQTKEFSGIEKEKHATKEQLKKQQKQLKIILGVLGGFTFLFLLILLLNYNSTHINYEGIKFKMIKEGNLIFYNTFLPATSSTRGKTNYNFYIRTNPKMLKEVEFDGNLTLLKKMVIKHEEEFKCEGDGVIAVANLVNLYDFIGVNVSVVNKSSDMLCDNLFGRYIFVYMVEGNETKIEQYGPGCYKMYIKDCEILPATERFMLETFVKIHEMLD